MIAYGALLPVTRGITASDLRLIRDSLARSPGQAPELLHHLVPKLRGRIR